MAINEVPKRRALALEFITTLETFLMAFASLKAMVDEKTSGGYAFTDTDFTAADAPITLDHLDATRIDNAFTNIGTVNTHWTTNNIDDVFNAARPAKG